ncbi:MAG: VOC family protein [Solirubrobacteraceae bacterium]
MAIAQVFAGVPVADYVVAIAWYERLFGRPPDVIAHATEALWQGAGEGWIYVVGDAERAGHSLLTLMVEDLDDRVAALAERGLVPDETESVPGKYRKATFVDPDGNRVGFGQTV